MSLGSWLKGKARDTAGKAATRGFDTPEEAEALARSLVEGKGTMTLSPFMQASLTGIAAAVCSAIADYLFLTGPDAVFTPEGRRRLAVQGLAAAFTTVAALFREKPRADTTSRVTDPPNPPKENR